jgi:hypothetical protein
MKRTMLGVMLGLLAIGGNVLAQERPLSPTGSAAAQVQGKWVKPTGRGAPTLGGENYVGGKWIEINYGPPLKRGRDLFGSGAHYGKAALVGAPSGSRLRWVSKRSCHLGSRTCGPQKNRLRRM